MSATKPAKAKPRRKHPDSRVEAMRNAPLDDEPVTAEEAAAIRKGERDVADSKGIPWDQVRDELGLGD